jgi:hypothetical protein
MRLARRGRFAVGGLSLDPRLSAMRTPPLRMAEKAGVMCEAPSAEPTNHEPVAGLARRGSTRRARTMPAP